MNTIDENRLKDIIAYLKTNPTFKSDCSYDKRIYDLLGSLDVDADYQDNHDLIENKDINTMNIEELKTMYTFIVRGERYCLGHIDSYIKDGTLLKLANRHLELIQNIEKNEKQPLSDEGLTLLVNTCKKRIATVGGDGYEEIVLYKDDKNNQYYLHTYVKYVYMEKEEHASYIASKALVDKIFKYIDDNNVALMKNNKGIPLCGGDYILKFKYNEEIIRLDSSKMNDNFKAYGDISKMLYKEANEDNIRYQ